MIMKSSYNAHSKMLYSLMRSKMKFFETTPIGRIINRTSNDLNNLDFILPISFKSFTSLSLNVLTSIVTISISSTPYFPIAFFLFGLIYLYVQVNYFKSKIIEEYTLNFFFIKREFTCYHWVSLKDFKQLLNLLYSLTLAKH